MTVVLSDVGKIPDLRDQLMIFKTSGAKQLKMVLKNVVGIGSK